MQMELSNTELYERARNVARQAYENGLWSEQAAFNFMGCAFTEEQVESWERVMAKVVRAKKNGGVKEIWI